MDRKQLERWLAEEAADDDAAADEAFAQLFSAMPRVQSGPAFVDQAVTAAWRWRTRRRRLVAYAWAACAALVAAGLAVAVVGAPQIATGVVKVLAFVSGRMLPWLVAYTTVAMSWWWTLAHVGGVIASALLTPARVVAVVGCELFGILAFYALHRVSGVRPLGDARV